MLRLRALLVSAVGRGLLEREGSPEERAQLAALSACEEVRLPQADVRGSAPVPAAFRSVEHDERFAEAAAPVSLGVAIRAAQMRGPEALPAGAATITAVEPDSPASAAGLRPGDVIVGAPDEPVRERAGMKFFLASSPPGPRELEIVRGGRHLTVQAPLRKVSKAPEARDLPAAGRGALDRLVAYRGPLAAALAEPRPYMLFFWATWCKFCKDSIPELLALGQERGVNVIAITDEPTDVLDLFMGGWSRPFPGIIAIDADRRANEALNVEAYPTFVLVDEKGRMVMSTVGYRRERGLPVPNWSFKKK
jgi:thiol-disulfide isomerase/thioredoxin